jgi:hypothetical protein
MALWKKPHPPNPRASRRACVGVLLALAVFAAFSFTLLPVTSSHAQTSNSGVIYSRQPVFRIPFEIDAGERRLQEITLYVSADQGQTWEKVSSVRPEERGFQFRATHDGLYWFTVRTVDVDGRVYPTTVQALRPQLKVFVDTQNSFVTLRQAAPREGMVGVVWDIRKESIDPASFLLEYRLPGTVEWRLLSVIPSVSGQHYWNPGTNGAVDVRLRVRDFARNEGKGEVTVHPGMQDVRPWSNYADQESSFSSGRTQPGKLFVNSKRISLSYEIKEKGPSGVSAVELWYTQDGKKWARIKEDRNPESPCMVDVNEEGVYGFTLLFRNGVGLSEPPPRVGDPPQIWVEVDLTKPVVHWVNAEVGRGPDTGNLTITWKATDKNLARDPITISYATDAQGPWTKIEANLENTGRYVWRKGDGPPHSFLVKVEAVDKAGNVGEFTTPKPVLFDLVQPKGLITGVTPAKTGGEPTKPGADGGNP